MFRRVLLALVCLAATFGLSSAANATIFGFGFVIELYNGDAAFGGGNLFTTDNGDGTFTVNGAEGLATYISGFDGTTYGEDLIIGAGPSFFASEPTATIVLGTDGFYSFDNLALFGNDHFYDFGHAFGPDLFGFSGEVGGPAQFSLGINDSSPTPEVATWGMMVIGFGAMGAAMRRRRRTSVAFS
jgi:hypothetical protein